MGVVFLTSACHSGAHCTFGFDGRALSVDLFLDGRRTRFVTVNAPVTRRLTNGFFRSIASHFLDDVPHVLLGDFNCVLDTWRDLTVPGHGASNYYAKELSKHVRRLHLEDAWVVPHGDQFAATRARGQSATRIDRVYLPSALLSDLVECEVLQFVSGARDLSDHQPMSVNLTSPARPRAKTPDVAYGRICALR